MSEKNSSKNPASDRGSSINWFPGHMARAMRLIGDSLKQVDAVCEITDARIPQAGRNPNLDRLALRKPRIIVLNRADLADPTATADWARYFKSRGCAVISADCKSGAGVDGFIPAIRELLCEKLEKYQSRGMGGRAIKLMVVGIPNVGKSSFINRILGKRSAEAQDRPGVTRRNQWFSLADGIELMDTPGVLPPKIADERSEFLLACTGAIKDQILDLCTLASLFAYELSTRYPEVLAARYGIDPSVGASCVDPAIADPRISEGYSLLTQIALARKFIVRGGEPDAERAARTLLDEFRSGKLGRITLEVPEK